MILIHLIIHTAIKHSWSQFFYSFTFSLSLSFMICWHAQRFWALFFLLSFWVAHCTFYWTPIYFSKSLENLQFWSYASLNPLMVVFFDPPHIHFVASSWTVSPNPSTSGAQLWYSCLMYSMSQPWEVITKLHVLPGAMLESMPSDLLIYFFIFWWNACDHDRKWVVNASHLNVLTGARSI